MGVFQDSIELVMIYVLCESKVMRALSLLISLCLYSVELTVITDYRIISFPVGGPLETLLGICKFLSILIRVAICDVNCLLVSSEI